MALSQCSSWFHAYLFKSTNNGKSFHFDLKFTFRNPTISIGIRMKGKQVGERVCVYGETFAFLPGKIWRVYSFFGTYLALSVWACILNDTLFNGSDEVPPEPQTITWMIRGLGQLILILYLHLIKLRWKSDKVSFNHVLKQRNRSEVSTMWMRMRMSSRPESRGGNRCLLDSDNRINGMKVKSLWIEDVCVCVCTLVHFILYLTNKLYSLFLFYFFISFCNIISTTKPPDEEDGSGENSGTGTS